MHIQHPYPAPIQCRPVRHGLSTAREPTADRLSRGAAHWLVNFLQSAVFLTVLRPPSPHPPTVAAADRANQFTGVHRRWCPTELDAADRRRESAESPPASVTAAAGAMVSVCDSKRRASPVSRISLRGGTEASRGPWVMR